MTLDDLVEGFELFDSWEERYRYIIEMGKELEAFPDKDKVEDNRVQGCVSNVWMIHEDLTVGDGRIRFYADSDSHIVRGLIAILLLAYSDQTPAQILSVDIEGFFGQLGLEQHLSPNRRNGFFSMVERMQGIARAASC
jgi:cysteine desulfuration protein SufE